MAGKVKFTAVLTIIILLSSCSKQVNGIPNKSLSQYQNIENNQSENGIFTPLENFSAEDKKLFENLTVEDKNTFSKVFSLENEPVNSDLELPKVPQSVQNPDLELRSPAADGISFSNPLHIELLFKKNTGLKKNLQIKLDDIDITSSIKKGPLPYQWIAAIENPGSGTHKLTFVPVGKTGNIYVASFQYKTRQPIDRITELADASVKRFKIENMNWDWGEALLLYALARLDNYKKENRYQPFIESYYNYHLKKGIPEINWSDRCAPALAAFELYRKTGNSDYKEIGARVIKYLKEAKRTRAGGLNHLGTYFLSLFYPQSMWVDSLMMYNIFAAKWGKYMNDPQMTEFAASQPLLFADVLQNKYSKLWKHAYLTNLKRNIPVGNVYWLRGNGWAMAGITETLDLLESDNSKRNAILQVLNDTARGLLPYQSEIGMWNTVLNEPGKTYPESSGTALVAYGMLRGMHQGYLPDYFKGPAEKAYLSLLDRLEQKQDGVSMPEISDNTMPYDFLGYSLIPRRNDLAYGLAAMILTGIEYDSSNEKI